MEVKSGMIAFLDTEVDFSGNLRDIGAVRESLPLSPQKEDFAGGEALHTGSVKELKEFLKPALVICGHNVIRFDKKYIEEALPETAVIIDTLPVSALLFPKKPYHALLKNERLVSGEFNNPVSDSKKCRELLLDELAAWEKLSDIRKKIYFSLLKNVPEFNGFLAFLCVQNPEYIHMSELALTPELTETLIRAEFFESRKNRICLHAALKEMIVNQPVELSFAMANIMCDDDSLLPSWISYNYPDVDALYRALRSTPCNDPACAYCSETFSPRGQLKKIFGFDSFRTYGGKNLQEESVQAAFDGKSLLSIFPTGGGKSLTFQLPALVEGQAIHGLTVVISPLQSLMKDQVDGLNAQGIVEAVTVNGQLDPIERSKSIELVKDGTASILYISPESLRSKTIESLIMGRNLVRVVIDEAHCLSSWGQDFRVDYLYIGDFIAKYQELKGRKIPVSCFTATAKPKVVSDICDYFRSKLGIELELYAADADRENLHYKVFKIEKSKKYQTLRELLFTHNCPSICYTTRTRRAEEIAARLKADGFKAGCYHGKMDRDEKIKVQDAFLAGELQIVVATSAFGMGVNKSDVGLVVHVDISDSLENYVQEAGRAGRDENIEADCFVLYSEDDLDEHFQMLTRQALTINEIQQVWTAVKNLTKDSVHFHASALEIAREAGWDETLFDIETKVKTALMALEQSGYLTRGMNCPSVFADSISAKTAMEANERIRADEILTEEEKSLCVRLMGSLISARATYENKGAEPETRVDYLADILGAKKRDVFYCIERLREMKLLENNTDLTGFLKRTQIEGTSRSRDRYRTETALKLEDFLFQYAKENPVVNYCEVNEAAAKAGIEGVTIPLIRDVLLFWVLTKLIKKPVKTADKAMHVEFMNARVFDDDTSIDEAFAWTEAKIRKRHLLTGLIFKELLRLGALEVKKLTDAGIPVPDNVPAAFSIQQLKALFPENSCYASDVQDCILFMEKVRAFKVEGGFLVSYNTMQITRLELDNRRRYRKEDYEKLAQFYQSRREQIHIVGEYANMCTKNLTQALEFVHDYFAIDYKKFKKKYFADAKGEEVERGISPRQYKKLLSGLSDAQKAILDDDESKCIVVAAGPGSGKTKTLVHKLASLLLLEEVKPEQLLMLTFSRAAAMEFSSRLSALIGEDAARFVEIRTFHSYAFELLGKIGSLDLADDIVQQAADALNNEESELVNSKFIKTALVLDEAQDMDEQEYNLVQAIRAKNPDLRLIAVGDDDQNIFTFRGASPVYMQKFLEEADSKKYELVDNYRSCACIVDSANALIHRIPTRFKETDVRAVRGTAATGVPEQGKVVIMRSERARVTGLANFLLNQLATDDASNAGEHAAEQAGATAKPGQDAAQVRPTRAVFTRTNEDAQLMADLLNKNGRKARLLQSADGFNLSNLAEFRYFLERLKSSNEALISEEVWEGAVDGLKKEFATSALVSDCVNVLESFRQSVPRVYYRDVIEVLKETSFSDFIHGNADEIYVSTYHKAKGHEFDEVFMLLDSKLPVGKEQIDDTIRLVYVGMTRAKNKLYIYSSSELFDDSYEKMSQAGAILLQDLGTYPDPSEFTVTANLHDVNLGVFENPGVSEAIAQIRSGDALKIDVRDGGRMQMKGRTKMVDTQARFYLYAKEGEKLISRGKKNVIVNDITGQERAALIAMTSKKCGKTIEKYRKHGYRLARAEVAYTLYWYDQNKDREVQVILPRLTFEKM